MQDNDTPPTAFPAKGKLAIFAILVIVILAVYLQFGNELTLENLARHEAKLRELKNANLTAMLAGAFLLYVAVAGLSIPGALVLSLTYAWFFGFWLALPLVSFASTLGATLSFLTSRYLLRDSIQARFGDRLTGFNQSLERDGPFFLFTLRLIPAIPFFLVNVLMGLTPIRTGTFWWISQLGMLPGTAIYLFAGSSVPTLAELAERGTTGIFTPQIWLAFALLAAFPFVARKLMQTFRKADSATPAV